MAMFPLPSPCSPFPSSNVPTPFLPSLPATIPLPLRPVLALILLSSSPCSNHAPSPAASPLSSLCSAPSLFPAISTTSQGPLPRFGRVVPTPLTPPIRRPPTALYVESGQVLSCGSPQPSCACEVELARVPGSGLLGKLSYLSHQQMAMFIFKAADQRCVDWSRIMAGVISLVGSTRTLQRCPPDSALIQEGALRLACAAPSRTLLSAVRARWSLHCVRFTLRRTRTSTLAWVPASCPSPLLLSIGSVVGCSFISILR